MSEDDWGVAGFVFGDETGQWQRVKFDYNNYHAIRSDGTLHKFTDGEKASSFIRAQGARAVVKFYLETMARAA